MPRPRLWWQLSTVQPWVVAARSAVNCFHRAVEFFESYQALGDRYSGKEVEVLQADGVASFPGELGLPLSCCGAEGIRWLSGGRDKWVLSRHVHERFSLKPGEPGLAAGCTRHSAASSRGRPPCSAADDLAGTSHECGSAVATKEPSLRLESLFRGGSRKEERHHRRGRQGRCNLAGLCVR